jgi:hypothetical protein
MPQPLRRLLLPVQQQASEDLFQPPLDLPLWAHRTLGATPDPNLLALGFTCPVYIVDRSKFLSKAFRPTPHFRELV